MRRSGPGFSLIEVMVAMLLGGIVVGATVTSLKASLDEQGASKLEWESFTIAQQTMELLSALPRDHGLLSGNDGVGGGTSPATGPGTAADRECASIAQGAQHFRTNALGKVVSDGAFDVCIKVKDGHPFGVLKNVRVVVMTSSGAGNVLLQTIR
jgi:prepilin-type N-terminal cleavage/methylation domain-containing protein